MSLQHTATAAATTHNLIHFHYDDDTAIKRKQAPLSYTFFLIYDFHIFFAVAAPAAPAAPAAGAHVQHKPALSAIFHAHLSAGVFCDAKLPDKIVVAAAAASSKTCNNVERTPSPSPPSLL